LLFFVNKSIVYHQLKNYFIKKGAPVRRTLPGCGMGSHDYGAMNRPDAGLQRYRRYCSQLELAK